MSTPPLDPQVIIDIDGYLRPNVPAIIERHNKFKGWKDSIDEHEGGYDNFTKGYLKFGFNIGPKNEVVYREWAPNATEAFLIGDFSASLDYNVYKMCGLLISSQDEWNRNSHPMKKDNYGVWEITVQPLGSGACAIPHDSKVKVICLRILITLILIFGRSQ
jgi:1,4-alpha-glucan branching enzyme